MRISLFGAVCLFQNMADDTGSTYGIFPNAPIDIGPTVSIALIRAAVDCSICCVRTLFER